MFSRLLASLFPISDATYRHVDNEIAAAKEMDNLFECDISLALSQKCRKEPVRAFQCVT